MSEKLVMIPPYMLRQYGVIIAAKMREDKMHPPKAWSTFIAGITTTAPENGDNEYAKEFKKRLHKFCLEAYKHSLTPSGDKGSNPRMSVNPATPKLPDDVLAVAASLFRPGGGFFDSVAKGDKSKAKAERESFKSALTRLMDFYVAGPLGMTDADFEFPKSSAFFGKIRPKSVKIENYQNMLKTVLNQYKRYTVAVVMLSIVEKLFENDDGKINTVLKQLGVSTDIIRPDNLRNMNTKKLFDMLYPVKSRAEFASLIYAAMKPEVDKLRPWEVLKDAVDQKKLRFIATKDLQVAPEFEKQMPLL